MPHRLPVRQTPGATRTTPPRTRVICCPQFGARLRDLRDDESRQAVCDAVKNDFGLFLDRSTLLQYERGTVKAPDPVMLYVLAQHYGLDDVGELIVVLVKERLARPVGRDTITRSKFTREQRKIAEWFGEFSDSSKDLALRLLTKLRSADLPTTPVEPVRRRARP